MSNLAFALDRFIPEMNWTRNQLLSHKLTEEQALDNLNKFRVIQMLQAGIPGYAHCERRSLEAAQILREYNYFS